MLKLSYDFQEAILPPGVDLQTNVLLRFRADIPESVRRDLNLSLAIDRSGSMAGSSLQHALKAAEAIVEQLNPTDTLSVVVYDDTVDTPVPPSPVVDKAAFKRAIRAVRAGGITNLSGGWLQSCKYVKDGYDVQKVNRVLLLTDGHANMGICEPKILTTTASQKAEEGIVTSTLGFAQGFNEDLLIGMARAAGGNFYFIQSIDEATDVFTIELNTLRAVVGQNLKVTLELVNGVKLIDTLTLATVERNQTEAPVVTLGELYEGEDKYLGLSLTVPRTPVGDLTVLKLHYSADLVQNGALQQVSGTAEVVAKFGTVEEAAMAASSHVMLELSRLMIAKAKDNALALAEQGKASEAGQLLQTLIQDLQTQGLNENFEIAEEIEQLNYFASRLTQGALGNEGRKEMRDQSYQSLARTRHDLLARGVAAGDEIYTMPTVSDAGAGVELQCIREGGKLRIKVVSEGYDSSKNVQFPRGIRAEGARYIVEGLELSQNESFYRVKGQIARLTQPGAVDRFSTPTGARATKTAKPSKGPASAADLPTTDVVGDGILVQCVKDGSKLRARVVADAYEPDWNMRFPRSIREEGMLYVVEEIKVGPDGKSYIACGEIKRFVQS